MHSRILAFTLLSCALGACSASGGNGDVSDDKLAARLELERGMRDDSASGEAVAPAAAADRPVSSGATTPSAGADVCRTRRWYGDGECDAWCPTGDEKDCAPNGGGIACAEFFSPADGFCNFNDPCGPVQDEDCMKRVDPGTGSCVPPDQPVPVPTPSPRDGKCAPTSAEELKADPDCASLICPAIFSPADGVCNAKSPCDYVIDEDCARGSGGNSGGGIACIDIAYATNGKCEAAPGCEANDPVDCKSGGGTSGSPGVICDARLYPTNGRCEAPAGCEGNDPVDCKQPVICITIAYPKNGKCEAARGCEASDPDC